MFGHVSCLNQFISKFSIKQCPYKYARISNTKKTLSDLEITERVFYWKEWKKRIRNSLSVSAVTKNI